MMGCDYQDPDFGKREPVMTCRNCLRLERENAQLRWELTELEVRMPCGHRKKDMDDSYGECVLCKLQQALKESGE